MFTEHRTVIAFNHNRIWEIAPRADPVYRMAFNTLNSNLLPFGIMDNPLRLAHFLAQCLHETAGLTVTVENLSYRAPRLMQVWPNWFPTLHHATPFAGNPQKLANLVYGRRLGNYRENDGWLYRGRGLLQITGRANYRRVGDVLDIPLEVDPDLARHPDYVLPVAGAIWQTHLCNPLADRDDVKAVTKAINGGLHGLLDRERWLSKTRRLLGLSEDPRA